MFDSFRSALQELGYRIRRFEHRELRDIHRWLEDTNNVLLLSVLLFVPLLMGLLTYISNSLDILPFLLFPPLASGAYTLFTRPESRSASPRRFIGGLTLGAASGWLALELTARFWYNVAPSSFTVHPGAAAFGLLLTGGLTWAFDLEEAQAFSTSLLVLVTGTNQFIYVVSVFVSSAIVAGVFSIWHHNFYQRRAEILYATISTDDHILVPLQGDGPEAERVASFAAQLAASHEAGKLVLLDAVQNDRQSSEGSQTSSGVGNLRQASSRLKVQAKWLSETFDVPCETVVTGADEAEPRSIIRTAEQTNCDLIVVPYAMEDGDERISPFIRTLFNSHHDVIATRITSDRAHWKRLLVPVRRDGEVAHAMVDFAERLAGTEGSVTVCHCIDNERRRPQAEAMLANLVNQFEQAVETRVSRMPLGEHLEESCAQFDMTFIGASSDRTTASRILSPPSYQKLREIDCDFAIVHRG